MEKIRKGNDIEVQWAIYAGYGINEAPYDLTGRNLTLYLRNQFGRHEVYEYTVEKHIIKFVIWGKDQKQTGTYSIELVENEGRQGMHTVDECDAFQLVNHSCQTGGDSEGRVECVHLQFRANMGITIPNNGGGETPAVEVDDALSTTSTNPVQNKVITKEINRINERIDDLESPVDYSEAIKANADAIKANSEAIEANSEAIRANNEAIASSEAAVNNLRLAMAALSESVASLDEKVVGYDNEISEAVSKSNEAVIAVNSIAQQIESISEEVETLSGKVDSLENGEITWTDVQ